MSIDITEKQHYVWRRYLSSWQDNPEDNRLWTGLMKQRQVKKLGLKDVAQSRYFYKLEVLTDEELSFLKQYKEALSKKVRMIADVIISGYEWYSTIKKDIAAGKITMTQAGKHELKKMEANVFESIHSQIENMGDALLICHSSKEIEYLAVQREYDILFYLMIQYMRTKVRKDCFANALDERADLQSLADKCWPFFNIVTAMQWVEAMAYKQDYRFIFVHNNSDFPFITGDQPAINTRWKEMDEKGNITGLEVYYPISPKTALVLDFTPGDKFCDIDVDSKYVKDRNKMIKEEAGLYIFANDKNLLKEMMEII